MPRSFYILGTGPAVGKTVFCRSLLNLACSRGQSTSVFKPIETGCSLASAPSRPVQIGGLPGQTDSESVQALSRLEKLVGPVPSYILGQTPQDSRKPRDGKLLLAASGRDDITLDEITLHKFAPDLEPAICARYANTEISLQHLKEHAEGLAHAADLFLLEGFWSLMSPISGRTTQLDLVEQLKLPVVLLVPSIPGAVGPCLLTIQTLISRGVKISGVVICRMRDEIGADEAAIPFQIETYFGDIVRGVIPFFNDEQLLDLGYLSERLRVHVDVNEFLIDTE
jgi:dethiobiotin synthase